MNAKRRSLFFISLTILTTLLLGGCAALPLAAPEETPAPTPTDQPNVSASESTAPAAVESGVQTVTFQTADGLTVTAELYLCGKPDAPFILLFHQADYSRGEYLEIAPKLNAWGYNCLAVDQRSGGMANKVLNETHRAAKAANLPTGYKDAYPDLEAALQYVVSQYAPKQLIAWGSSYSASLVLILAAEHPDEIQAVLSFSPGEYFRYHDQSVADFASKITQPVFITSAKSEENSWRGIADQIKSDGCVFFVPEENGRHGSSALFEETPNNAEYWTAVEGFLRSLGG